MDLILIVIGFLLGIFIHKYSNITVNDAEYIAPSGEICKVTNKNIFFITVGYYYSSETVWTIDFMLNYEKI